MKSVIPGARTLLLQVLATSFMTGLIWFVQVVHYPLMEGWPHDDFGRWEVAHRNHTGPVVIPPMLIEGIAAVWLLVHRPRGVHPLFPIVGMTALLGIWASTFFLQVPCHLQLSEWPFLWACYGSSGWHISQIWPTLRPSSRTPNLPIHSRLVVLSLWVWSGRLFDV